jgi:glycogen synthase
LMIIEEPKAGLGDLSDDVEYYLRRVEESNTIPSKKNKRWSTYLTFRVPTRERDILFAALSRLTWQEGYIRSLRQHKQEGL